MTYDITRPWTSLDEWQMEYIYTPPEESCFLLCGRQVGKTTAMSIKAVELCLHHFKKGEYVLIASITEKQAYHMLVKALSYAEEVYPTSIQTGKDRPTMHKIMFRNGTGILCYAAGESGEGLRGFSIKKQMIDEGSRMSEEFFIAISPQLSVMKGSMDIASTPAGKRHKDGTEKFFYKCSKDPNFRQFYVSAEDCPRHSRDFLEKEKDRLPKLAYAQEYLAVFTDELKRLFDESLIKKACILNRVAINPTSRYFLGVDVAGFGRDECTFEVTEMCNSGIINHIENTIEKRNYTTDTTKRVLDMDLAYNFKQIGVDDAGIGFGVYSELMNNEKTKRRTIALNNSSRPLDRDETKHKKILKEEMYMLLLSLMENDKIRLLDDEELKASLASIQIEEDKIFGSYSHIVEGLVRSVWLASQTKGLNIWVHSLRV
jgi:hypothetical protein